MLLRRGRDLQVGYDAPTNLVLTDPDHTVESMLRRCDGSVRWPELAGLAKTQALPPRRLSEVLIRLAEIGMAELRESDGAPEPVRVRLVGAGPLGVAVGDLLLADGVDVLYVLDSQPPDPALYPLSVSGSAADAYRAAVSAASSSGSWDRVVVVNHWSKPESAPVPLTVVASDTVEPDRPVVEGLLRIDAPHLVVRPAPGGAVVGPLVLPHRTSCVHCADLTRRDADPGWPDLLPQLTRLRPSVSAGGIAWAAATAVQQVLGFLALGEADTVGATLELAADHRLRRRLWPAHPACSCSW